MLIMLILHAENNENYETSKLPSNFAKSKTLRPPVGVFRVLGKDIDLNDLDVYLHGDLQGSNLQPLALEVRNIPLRQLDRALSPNEISRNVSSPFPLSDT